MAKLPKAIKTLIEVLSHPNFRGIIGLYDGDDPYQNRFWTIKFVDSHGEDRTTSAHKTWMEAIMDARLYLDGKN